MGGGSWQCTVGSDQEYSQEIEKQKGIGFSEEALTIAEERREAKGKGERERYTRFNAEL